MNGSQVWINGFCYLSAGKKMRVSGEDKEMNLSFIYSVRIISSPLAKRCA